MIRTLMFVVTMAVTFLQACGASAPPPTYAGTARHRYELGQAALADEDYLEAVKHFTFVKNKFAYSKYAALAEIGVADSYFAQKKYIESIDAFRTFMQSRPNHERVPYAMWRIGVAHHEQVPGDFFLFPPSHEKDLGSTKDALRSLRQFTTRFPKDPNVKDAEGRIRACRDKLAEHEMYVAGFYLRSDRPRSAQGRLETVVRDFEDVPNRWREAAWLLVQTHVSLAKKAPDEAATHRAAALAVAKQLAAKGGASEEAADARAFVANRGG